RIANKQGSQTQVDVIRTQRRSQSGKNLLARSFWRGFYIVISDAEESAPISNVQFGPLQFDAQCVKASVFWIECLAVRPVSNQVITFLIIQDALQAFA